MTTRRTALATVLVGLSLVVAPSIARGDGVPDVSLDKSTSGTVLWGETSTVTLTASNPAGQPTGYNLSARDVLPPGVSYVPGSASPAVGDPQQIADAPGPGQTTLIWTNLADLTPNSTLSLSYQVTHDTGAYGVGDTYDNTAGIYINCNPAYVPEFDAQGNPLQSGGSADCSGAPPETSYTGFATDTAATTITAVEIEKSEPSPEGELLRGLHDHQTVYTLDVTNNSVTATDDLVIEDLIPAGLEFLACGTEDNTSDAPTNPGSAEEYPGSGPINPGNSPGAPDCVEPDEVATVTNPPGRPPGVYTRVRWEGLGNLAPGATFKLQYVAAIPIRENTADWNGTGPGNGIPPLPGLGNQASNLDNNSGPETFEEGGSEPSFENQATATVEYDDGGGPLAISDTDTEAVTAEDVRVVKSVDTGALSSGEVSEWTLALATGEYRFVDDVVVTDTLGDGYCPLGAVNHETTPPPLATSECDPTGDLPSQPYTSVTEQTDGSFVITWDSSTDAALERMEPSSTHTIAFPSMTRFFYQENFEPEAPVLALDRLDNNVSIAGDDWIRCAPGDPSPLIPGVCGGGQDKIDADEADGTPDGDNSSASQQGPGASINKTIDQAANTADCLAGTYDEPAPTVRPGDTICFRLRMNFPGELSSGQVEVTDFIPPGTTYVPGSTQETIDSTATIGTGVPPEPDVDGTRLSWPIDDLGGFVGPARVFEVVFKVAVDREATTADGDVLDNLMKAAFSNSDGQTFPLRDESGYEVSQPELTLLKGVSDVNDGSTNPPNTDGVTVQGGDVVTYRIDIANDGSLDADDAEVWDELPPGIECADVSSIFLSGTCNAAESRVEWTGIDIAAGGSTSINYDVTIPDDAAPGDVLVNNAGVRTYQSASGSGPYTSVPSNNIDPTLEPSANASPADDPSNVVIEGVEMTKSRTTDVTEPGNTAAQATIGEEIDYTVTATIPEGTTLYGPAALTDDITARHVLVGTPTATLDTDGPGGGAPVALPTGGVSVGVSGTVISVNFPEPYVNPSGSGDDIVELTFTARPADTYPTNWSQGSATQQILPNSATLAWESAEGTARNDSASTATELVEPLVSITKDDDVGGVAQPGETVGYTLTVSNSSAARVSTAHDATIVDQIPDHLTPVNGGVPVADGGTVDPDGGIWDATARTITWEIATLDPGESTDITYEVILEPGAVGAGILTNTATIEADSMAGTPDGQRTPGSPGDPTGYDDIASNDLTTIPGEIVKSVTPGEGTIGESFTYTISISIEPNLVEFDAALIDLLPNGLVFDEYVSATCVSGCAPGPTNITPSTITPVNNGDGTTTLGWWVGDTASAPALRQVDFVYRAHIADTYDGASQVVDGDSLTNTATAMLNTTDEEPGTPPATPPDPADYDFSGADDATIEVVEPELAIDKDVSGDPEDDDARDADPGDSFTYTLRVTNNGTSPAYDVVVTDQPDAELTNVTPTIGAGSVTEGWAAADPDMAWLIPGPIGVGDTVTLAYTADLVPSAQLSQEQQVINTADVPEYWGRPEAEREANSTFDYRRYDDVDDDTVTITIHVPALDLEKTTGVGGFPDNAPAEIEAAFPWRIVITNTNTTSRLLGVDLNDTLPSNWSYVAGSAQVSGTGALTPGGQVEPTITGGGAQLSWENLGDLDGGETIVVEFEAEPSAQAAIDPGIGVAHPNAAEASGEDTSGAGASADGDYADDDDATATLLAPEVDLTVEKVADDPTPVAGTDTSWTIVATNNGPDTSPEMVVEDAIPAGLTFVSATPEQGSCSFGAGVVTCELGTVPATRSVEIDLVTHVGADQAGNTIVNPAAVSDEFVDEADLTNNDDNAEITPRAEAQLQVTKVSQGDLQLGLVSNYRIDVTNEGPSVATDVVLTDPLPSQLVYVSADNPGCSAVGQDVTCQLGAMNPGQTITVNLQVRVVAYSPEVTNGADVTSPDGGHDHDDTTDPIVNTDIALRKAGPKTIAPGEGGRYKIKVTNVGDSPTGGTVTVTDKLPKGAEPRRAKGKGWTCDIAGQKVTCERSDSLAPGRSWPRIKIDFRVAGAFEGKLRNTAVVKLPGDPVRKNNHDGVNAAVGAGAAPESCLGGTLGAVPARVPVGAPTVLKLILENADGSPARSVTIVVDGPDGDRWRDKTNRGGKVKFEVTAGSSDDRWVAKAKECGLRERIKAIGPDGCRGGADAVEGEADGVPPARRRC